MASHPGESEGAASTDVFVEDVDERLASMLHRQQLQQKQEVTRLMESHTVTNADTEFRRGLEELVRDHLNTCMVLASCSSAHDSGIASSSNAGSHTSSFNSIHENANEDDHGDHGDEQNVHHYQDSTDVPSYQTDAQTFQTGETTFILDNDANDDNQESVNQLVQSQSERDSDNDDHSQLEEPPRSRVLSMWAAQHAQEMITTMERQAREAELLALAGLHTVSTLDASFLRESPPRPDPGSHHEERPRRRASIVQMWRESEEEQRSLQARNELEEMITFEGSANHGEIQMEVAEGQNIDRGSVEEAQINGLVDAEEREASQLAADSMRSENPDYTSRGVNGGEEQISMVDTGEGTNRQSQEGERERVRQIVQRLMTDNELRGLSSVGQAQHRAAWLDENERERVRELAREWVRVTDDQRAVVRDSRAGALGRQQTRSADESPGSVDDGFLTRSQQRYRNQQAILDLLMRAEQERQRELQLLVEHRAVSDFAHRHRLQSLLRGRFLRTGGASEDERPPSLAASELGQLRQRRAVSGIREGFRFRLETVLRGQVNNAENADVVNAHTIPQRRGGPLRQAVQISGADSQVTRGTPIDSVPSGLQGTYRNRRVVEVQNLGESTANNMELQELLGRRSVSNVLASEFRDRLDRLIRSFLHTQGRTPVAWDATRNGRTGGISPPQQRSQHRQQQPQRAAFPPPPPPPPLQPLWQQELQQGTWPRPSSHRPPYTESESISELKTDISKLQHGMSDLRRIMETCMEMQLELQRSVRQELAGALQRMYEGKAVPDEAVDGSKWVSVRKGICCVCCDRNIDSLLYRCGHMCTCLKCASVLLRNSGKCPMCRAPIVEVVRAFTVG